MRTAKQLSLSKDMIREIECGGDYSKGKRKSRRPFSSKEALHVVCRSEIASGKYSLLLPRNRKLVDAVITSLAEHYGIKIYDRAINSNHCHLLLRAASKKMLNAFLRAMPGILAMRITGARKGNPLLKKFWAQRIWSRIVSFGRDFRTVKAYILQNVLEAQGLIPYAPRKNKKCRSPVSLC